MKTANMPSTMTVAGVRVTTTEKVAIVEGTIVPFNDGQTVRITKVNPENRRFAQPGTDPGLFVGVLVRQSDNSVIPVNGFTDQPNGAKVCETLASLQAGQYIRVFGRAETRLDQNGIPREQLRVNGSYTIEFPAPPAESEAESTVDLRAQLSRLAAEQEPGPVGEPTAPVGPDNEFPG